MKRTHVLALLVTFFLVGCASTGEGGQRSQRNLITVDEIQTRDFNTAHDIVWSLRPSWLRTEDRSGAYGGTITPLLVYVDGSRVGDVDFLKQIPATNVTTMRYLNPSEANTRFGTGHAGGVIIVNTGVRGI
jgi:hypothetical protein